MGKCPNCGKEINATHKKPHDIGGGCVLIRHYCPICDKRIPQEIAHTINPKTGVSGYSG